MEFSKRSARRLTVVLFATLSTAAVMIMSAGSATAGFCDLPTHPDNTSVNAMDLAGAGVSRANTGTPSQDASVCMNGFLAVGKATVDVTPQGATGTSATVTACASIFFVFYQCDFGNTPFRVVAGAVANPPSGLPSPSVDLPQDGNGRSGADLGTANTACVWTEGVYSSGRDTICSGGYDQAYVNDNPTVTPPSPDPVGLVNYLAYEAQYGAPHYATWCTDPLYWGYQNEQLVLAIVNWCSFVLGSRVGAALSYLL